MYQKIILKKKKKRVADKEDRRLMGIYPSRDDKKKREELWENIERVAGRHNSLIKHCDHNFVIHNLGKKKNFVIHNYQKKKLCHHYMDLKDVSFSHQHH
jgi:hypothetical protein